MTNVLLVVLFALLCWGIYRYGRWFFYRIHLYRCLRTTAKRLSFHFVVKDPLWFFARNGDGKVSFLVESDSTLYFIHLCGALSTRCSYIFRDETCWICRQYGFLGRGMFYTDKVIDVQKVKLPEDEITIKREQVVYLFAPVPVGCGLSLSSREGSLPCAPGQEIPGGILHNTESFCTQLKKDLEKNI